MDLTGRIGRPLKWVWTTDVGFDVAGSARCVDEPAACEAAATDANPTNDIHAIARIPARKTQDVPATSLLMVERTGG